MVKMRNSRLPIIMAVQYINMSELNAYLTTKYGIFFAYTKVLIFPQSTKLLGKKTKIISLYINSLLIFLSEIARIKKIYYTSSYNP